MKNNLVPPERQIRACFNDRTVTVYQAYSEAIARPALEAQTFVPPFKRERMTWIKPSFLWMMCRSGWGRKAGQESILSIEMTREGFEWALEQACLSHFHEAVHESYEAWQAKLAGAPVRVQWDPERDLHLQPLPYRAIQIGLSGEAVSRYVADWIVAITSVTELAGQIAGLVEAGKLNLASQLLPAEQPYPLPEALKAPLGMQP